MINSSKFDDESKGGNNIGKLDPEKILEERNNMKIQCSSASLRVSEFCSVCQFINSVKIVKGSQNKPFLTVWDAAVEFGSDSIVDMGIASRADMIVLGGLNAKIDRIRSFLKFVGYLPE